MRSIKAHFINDQHKQTKQIKISFGLIALLLFVALKCWYSQANIEDLRFLLRPTSFFVHLITNQNYTFLPESGYHFPHLNVLIDASCAGGNWWFLAFMTAYFSALNYLNKSFQFLIFLPGLLFFSYLAALLVNSTRIVFSIFITAQFSKSGSLIHLAEGIFVYLSSLIIWHLFCQYFFKKIISQS